MVFKEPINKKKFLAAGQTKCANKSALELIDKRYEIKYGSFKAGQMPTAQLAAD